MQNLGVMLFFVLSGFLVSRSAMTKMPLADLGGTTYMLERIARIFVPFVPAVLIVSVLDRLILHGQDTPFIRVDLDKWTLVTNLTMVYNNPVMDVLAARTGLPLDTRPIGTAAPFWTVVIEFWIYIAFGLILLRIIRDRRIGVLGILALAFSLAVVVDTAPTTRAWCSRGSSACSTPGASPAVVAVRPLPHRVLGVVGLVATPLLLWQNHGNVSDERVALALGLAVLSTWLGFATGPHAPTV